MSNTPSTPSNSPTSAAAPVAVTTSPEAKPSTKHDEGASPLPEGNKEAQAAEQKEAARRYKLKIDGREADYDEAEVLRLATLGGGANKKFEAAAKARKEAEQALKMMREDFFGVAEKLGIDVDSLAEERLWKRMQAESLTPEQKRQQGLEAELERFRAKEREDMTAKEREAASRAEQHYAEHYDRLITEGLSSSGLPKTASTVRSVANYLNKALEAGYDATVEDVIPLVKQDYIRSIQELFGSADGDTLLSLLGDGVSNKIRKADLARLRGQPVGDKQPPMADKSHPTNHPSNGRQQAPKKDEKMDKYAWQERISRKLGI